MPPKTGLREFQEQLAARLTTGDEGDAARFLGFEAAGRLWLLPAADSGELLPLAAPLHAVPLTRPWFAGLLNVRGNLYGVTDFSRFLGGDPTPRDADARLLLIGNRHPGHSALLVARSFGLCPAHDWEAQAAPGAAPWISGSFVDGQARCWERLDVCALLAAPDFLAVGI